MDKRLQKWLRWLEIIKGEVQELVIAKHTFHEVQKMIGDNPKLQKGNSFYHYLISTYISHVVIGLRRQIKTDDNSISLASLLEDIIATPEVLSRRYYVSLYKGSSVEDLADGDFDRFSGPGAPHIDASMVAADLSRLREASAKCEDFADKRVAHRDRREPKSLPTYNEVDACIDLLDELFAKYQRVFHAKASETLLPTWQYDWKSIFRTPWIP